MIGEPERCPYDSLLLIRDVTDPHAWLLVTDGSEPTERYPNLRGALKRLGDLTRVESGYRSLRD